jgi:cytochrome P450
MNTTLPPGPRMPALLQMIGNWSRPTAFLERARHRYGKRFTVRFIGQSPIVMISDPDEIKQVFQAPPDVLHPGEGARILEPVVGPNSVILLDEGPHLEQRKLLLPSFHGEKMQALAGLMEELTEREISSWPRDEVVALHPRLQRLTLEIILRAVFGLKRGAQLETLRDLLTRILSFGESPISLMPPLPPVFERFGPMKRLQSISGRVDAMLAELIEERRREGADGDDVLSLLLAATHEDGSPMTTAELRDELVTALVAGHETTASQLGWTFSRLAREPRALALLYEEIDGGGDDAYLAATITESMRVHPVLPNAEPRMTKRPFELGDITLPEGVAIFASAYLVHHDPDVYPEPYAFRPERFIESSPGTYTWIPFGGGRRRCLGASFAQLEMKIVVRAVLQRFAIQPDEPAPETARRRGITLSPSRGCRVILTERSATQPPERADAAGAPEPAPALVASA